MKRKLRMASLIAVALACEQALGQSINQPTPTDLELAFRQIQAAAECNLKIDHDDTSINYLLAAGGGRLEHYSAPDRPFNVLGLKSTKIDTYNDPEGKLPDLVITFVYASLNTVKQTANLAEPINTDVGTLSVRYGNSPGVVEIVCTVATSKKNGV